MVVVEADCSPKPYWKYSVESGTTFVRSSETIWLMADASTDVSVRVLSVDGLLVLPYLSIGEPPTIPTSKIHLPARILLDPSILVSPDGPIFVPASVVTPPEATPV